MESLPEGWERWAEDRRGDAVLVYRPDVFDGSAYPAECLPTIATAPGGRSRSPGTHPSDTAGWIVRLSLEPLVVLRRDRFPDREAATSGALDLARRFTDGEFDCREAYEVPREDYLGRLENLLGVTWS